MTLSFLYSCMKSALYKPYVKLSELPALLCMRLCFVCGFALYAALYAKNIYTCENKPLRRFRMQKWIVWRTPNCH